MSFNFVLVYCIVILFVFIAKIQKTKAATVTSTTTSTTSTTNTTTNNNNSSNNNKYNNNNNNNYNIAMDATNAVATNTPQPSSNATAAPMSPAAGATSGTTTTTSSTSLSSTATTTTTVALAATTTTTVPASSTTQASNSPAICGSTLMASTNAIISSTNTNNNNTNSTTTTTVLPTQSGLLLPIDLGKTEDANNSSLASAMSEGQRSLSGAPSASSSPILSPPGKIFGRNANGTMIATSRPSNEAEIQLYRVLQRASLLAYYDTLLEMGGDDVQQLYEAGEEEFLEIMALVGMASKPLHVRRLQKALHEWANNPSMFQGPMMGANQGLCDTPTKATAFLYNSEAATPSAMRYKFSPFNPTPLLSTAAQTSSTHLLSQMCSPALALSGGAGSTVLPVTHPNVAASTGAPLNVGSTQLPPLPMQTGAAVASITPATVMQAISASQQQQQQQYQQPPPPQQQQSSSVSVSSALSVVASQLTAPNNTHCPSVTAGLITSHQVTSSSPQLTPVLTEMQISRITVGAEKIARHLPQREPRAQTSKKRTTRELEQVMNMSEADPRRMDEIRKYSAIYGRFDCKRRPEKPLTLHEVCVNEAAAQLCRLVPALLTRRDELFPLARQIVKDAGFGHSASIARYGGLLQQMQTQAQANAAVTTATSVATTTAASNVCTATAMQALSSQRSSSSLMDCESSDSTSAMPALKRQRLLSTSQDSGGSTAPDLSRDPTEDARFNLFAMYQKFAKPPYDMTADVTKFSLARGDFEDNDNDSRLSSFSNTSSPPSLPANGTESERRCDHDDYDNELEPLTAVHDISGSPLRRTPPQSGGGGGGVHVISSAGGHIIAVANPALALSPTLHEALNMKRNENHSPEL